MLYTIGPPQKLHSKIQKIAKTPQKGIGHLRQLPSYIKISEI
jgi:hypothetical protein